MLCRNPKRANRLDGSIKGNMGEQDTLLADTVLAWEFVLHAGQCFGYAYLAVGRFCRSNEILRGVHQTGNLDHAPSALEPRECTKRAQRPSSSTRRPASRPFYVNHRNFRQPSQIIRSRSKSKTVL
jgi:hypothetical protein